MELCHRELNLGQPPPSDPMELHPQKPEEDSPRSNTVTGSVYTKVYTTI